MIIVTLVHYRWHLIIAAFTLCAAGLAWLRLLDKAAERLDLKIKPIGEAS